MTCLVTGVAGFAGSHLAAELVRRGFGVTGIAMPEESLARLEGLGGAVEVRRADVGERASLEAALEGLRPRYVFHLAAIASVPAALSVPHKAFLVNTLGTVNLLEAMRDRAPERFLYISSADVYGSVPTAALPVRESRPLRPASPYSSSKAAAEVAAFQYWRTYALPVAVIRPFNHTGAGQGPGFAPSDFARSIARIEKGLDPPRLSVGNLESRRDYSDVRDVVRGYALAAERAEPGEAYNICRGTSVRIADVLAALLGRSKASIEVVRDPARSRPSDSPVVCGDHSKFTRRTGWQAEIPLEETLSALLEWWRTQV